MNMQERVVRFTEMLESGRLIRRRWTGRDAEGRELACWLAALSPEVGEGMSSTACPAEVMPQSLTHLIPWMDDSVSDTVWPMLAARLGSLAGRWHVLDTAAWDRCDIEWRRIAVVEALSHVSEDEPCGVRASCLAAIKWLDAGVPATEATRVARAADAVALAARAAARAAGWSALAAVRAAADRMASAIFDVIEKECLAAEAS